MQGQIEAWEEWPDGYATPNRRIMYAEIVRSPAYRESQ